MISCRRVAGDTTDPGRHYSPSRDLQQLAQYRARSVPDLEHPNLQEVRVYRLLPETSGAKRT